MPTYHVLKDWGGNSGPYPLSGECFHVWELCGEDWEPYDGPFYSRQSAQEYADKLNAAVKETT